MEQEKKVLTILSPIDSNKNIERFLHSFKFIEGLKIIFIIDRSETKLIDQMNLISKLHPKFIQIYSESKNVSQSISKIIKLIDTKYIKIMHQNEWSLEKDTNILIKKLRKINSDIVDCDWKISETNIIKNNNNSIPVLNTSIKIEEISPSYVLNWHSMIASQKMFLRYITPFAKNMPFRLIIPILFLSNAQTITKLNLIFIRTSSSNSSINVKFTNKSEMKILIEYLCRNISEDISDNILNITIKDINQKLLFFQKVIRHIGNDKKIFFKTIDYIELHNKKIWKRISKKWKMNFLLPKKIYY